MEAGPDLPGAAFNLGVLLREQGRLEEAEAAFSEAARRAPRSALPATELGLVQRMRGRFAQAGDSYARALSVDPQFGPALRNVAILHDLYLDDPGAAIEPFERYKSITGEDRPVTSWIADVKQRAGRREPAAASPASGEPQ